MKRILKILGVLIVLVLVFLMACPYILEAKIGEIIKRNVNNNVNATLSFADAKLSLISSFPNAEVSLTGVSLINKTPFKGDTLFTAQHIDLKIGVFQLFKNQEQPIAVEHLNINQANLNLVINTDGQANYDISKASHNQSISNELNSGFQFDLHSYEIINSNISYLDKSRDIFFSLLNLQHMGNGDLSLEKSELDTYTEALVSLDVDNANYLNENKIKLNALIGIDLKEKTYSFLKNEALLNQLPLVFEGFVKLNDESQEVDINFKTKSSNFRNFLAVIPERYTKNIEDVTTTGYFIVEGKFKGLVDDYHIPKFNIDINSDNASLKYPDLPKAVSDVFIDVSIENTTGIIEDTFVNIDKFSFRIDEDTFSIGSKITKLIGNTNIDAHIDGVLNLENLDKAYPFPVDIDIKGILNTDIKTSFDMASVQQKRYQNTKTSGNIHLNDFEYKPLEMVNPIKLDSASLNFNLDTVLLHKLKGSIGKTDFYATGSINNLLGSIFNNEIVKGDFDMTSQAIALKDFITKKAAYEYDEDEFEIEPLTTDEKIKIPSFLDVNINMAANTVRYDNLLLKDLKGNLKIKDKKAILSNMTASIFDGVMAIDGEVSTNNEVPTFAMKLAMNQLQITNVFKSLELFRVLAPVAQVLKGNLDSDIQLSGSLNDTFTPNLPSLSGEILAKVFANDIAVDKAPLLSALDSKLGFIDLKQLNLDDVNTKLSFKNGVVTVEPFEIKYQDIVMTIDGSHTFKNKLNYKASMNVPAKYLGRTINTFIAKIYKSETNDIAMPVIVNIGGSYKNPMVTSDLSTGVKTLTSKLVEMQKQKLINEGKYKAKDVLNSVLGNTTSKKDSSQVPNNPKEAASDIIDGILGGNDNSPKSKNDSMSAKKDEDVIKEATKNIFGGLLGKKKKGNTESNNDSIN